MRARMLAVVLLVCAPAAEGLAQVGDVGASTGAAGDVSSATGGAARTAGKPRRKAPLARARRAPRKKSPYDKLKESWHAPPDASVAAEAHAASVPVLVFRLQGKSTPYVLKPNSRQGGFDTAQLEVGREAFGSWKGGPLPHPRVLDLIYAATLHFDVPFVHLISGVRRDRGASRHSHGLAADIVLPGIEDEELAAFFRAQGFVGVGTYPRSGFVHVDTRDKSYFWVDSSSPGQRGRVKQVRAAEARQVDEAALARGSDTFVNPPRLQKALNARLARRRRARAHRDAARIVTTTTTAAGTGEH